jgi:tetratricopeptide (TPR) repeat protein
MTETSPRSSVRSCPGCGERPARGANFCSACGRSLEAESSPEGDAPVLPATRAGLIVLVGFLAVGLGLWVLLLAPRQPAGRMPLAKSSPPADAAAGADGALPQDHPPLELPADVKKYIGELEAKAAANPKDLQVWKTTAQVEYRAGQIDRAYAAKAEASFRHVLELDANDLEAIRGMGNVHFDREEFPQAVESYSRYLAIRPDDLSVRTDLGTMYLYGGDPDKAIVEYGKVLASDPKFYQAHYNLGIAYAQKGKATEALASLGRARSLAPDDRTRKQIDAMIEHAKSGGAAAPSEEGAGEPKTFQARIEDRLRAHPIVGPKIARLEWTSPTVGSVRLRDFPMQGMPETVRQKFLDRLKGDLADAKQRSGATGAARLDLVDDQSGQVMASVSAE